MRVMSVKYSHVHESLVSMMDLIQSDPDPINRLVNMTQLEREMRSFVIPARNQAAYDAKMKYTTQQIVMHTRLLPSLIEYWSGQHRKKTGAPRKGKRDLSGARDLRHLHRPTETIHPTKAQG